MTTDVRSFIYIYVCMCV